MSRSYRFLPAFLPLIAGVLAVPAADAQTQMQARLRGTIERVDGPLLQVKARNGDDLHVRVASDAAYTAMVKASLADVKAGVYIGTAARTMPDGTLQAIEVHIFEEDRRGTGEGHRPMEEPSTSMTNANIESVVSGAQGRTLKLAYKGGQQTVTVPDNTPIVRFAAGKRSEIVRGTAVVLTVQPGPNGSIEATRIAYGRDGVTPP